MADIVRQGEELELTEQDHYHYGQERGPLRLRADRGVPWPHRNAEVVKVSGVRILDDREAGPVAVWVRRDALVSHADRHHRWGDPSAG